MKKFLLGAMLLFCTVTIARADCTVTTSCGTHYILSSDGASAADMIEAAMILDLADCG